MEATESCTKAIGATQQAGLLVKTVIDTMYEGCISRLVLMQYLVMSHVRHMYMLQSLVRPHVRHVCALIPIVRPHVRHARLDLYIAVILKGRTIFMWSFGCDFTCATAMGYAGFRLSLFL